MTPEESELWSLPRAEARNRLVELHMSLAHYHTKLAVQKYPVEYDILLSWASEGLMQAVEKFEPARGLQFSTFARHRIRGRILDGIREADWTTRYHRAAMEADGNVVQVRQASQIDRKKDGRWDSPLDRAVPPARVLERLDAADEFHRLTRGLSRRDIAAIVMYYRDGLTMDEIGKALGLSQSRVSQMLTSALASIRSRIDPALLGPAPGRRKNPNPQRRARP